MTKLKLPVFLLIVCYFFFARFVVASREIDDFHYQYEKYTEVYQDFAAAKDQYLKYKTLTAKEKAETATKKLINQRNQVLRTYFLALKWKLRTAPHVVGADKRAALMAKLDKEVNWLDSQNDQLQSLNKPDLESLFIISDRIEAKEDSFKLLAYQSLSAVLLGKVRDLYSQSVVITSLLAGQVENNKATKSAELKDWLKEIENKNYLAQKAIEDADNNLVKMEKKTRGNQAIPLYQKIKANLVQAKDYLVKAFSFQKEVYSALKLKEESGN